MEQIIRYYFDFSSLVPFLPDIWRGFVTTLYMSVLVIVFGIALGVLIAFVRAYQIKFINIFIVIYCDVMRALPPLIVIVMAYFALPFTGIVLEPITATVVSLSLVLAAFSAEIVWSGLTALRAGLWEAGRSTGLTFTQTLLHIALPPAIQSSIPSLTNRAIAASKATTLGSVISASELLSVTSSIQASLANPSALTLGALLFIVLFLPFVSFTRYLERRYKKGRV